VAICAGAGLIAATAVAQYGWRNVLLALLIGVLTGIAGLRVWRGNSINPKGSVNGEARLRTLTVTLVPGSLAFLSFGITGLITEFGGKAHGSLATVITVVEILGGVLGFIMASIGVSLFFFLRPRRLIPPHLRS
jgi:hypothetical protein